jgi:Ser/Thr protein kinase RdoA (MazF antagonist)
VSLDEELISDLIRSRYGLDVLRVSSVGVSENHGYRIETDGGVRYFARAHVFGERTFSRLDAEFRLLDQVAPGLPGRVPTGIRTCEGACAVEFMHDRKPCFLLLFSWLPGTHKTHAELMPHDMTAMVDTTARFHEISADIDGEYDRPVYDYEYYCGRRSFYCRDDLFEHVSEADIEPFLALRESFREYTSQACASEWGIIHYDLHAGNFLFADGQANAIDFDECGYGYYLFDLGHMLFALHDHERYGAFEVALIERYEAVSGRVLPIRTLRLFKGVQAVAIMHYFYRLFDRTEGRQNLFHCVPAVARNLAEIVATL